MQLVVSAEEMRWCDETAIRKLGVSGLLLMENAGAAVARCVKQWYPPATHPTVLVVCGKGNNGGDGFVVARHLAQWNYDITVAMLASNHDLQGDARTNFKLLRSLSREKRNSLAIRQCSLRMLKSTVPPSLIVDAIFGTGFSGVPRTPADGVIHWINEQPCPKIAVDIPSGVNATTGVAEGEAVCADATVSFGYVKTGLLCARGREFAGKIETVPIGIPKSVVESGKFKTFLVESADVRSALPRRSIHAHKHSVGKVVVLAGSKGLTGAAAMASLAALRAGAGAVVLGTPESVAPILARKLTEVMVQPLPSTDEGSLSLAALDPLKSKLDWADVVVIGPGLSQNSETQSLVHQIIFSYRGKVVIDADGLNALSVSKKKMVPPPSAEWILTPHTGELSRLVQQSSSDIERHRVAVARAFARSHANTLVLKGVPTATAATSGEVFINSTGNPGMATAGSGDVLTGTIAGLWAQGMKSCDAAFAGVYVHGVAGDLASRKYGQRSLLAGDILEFLPQAFRAVESEAFS
ncbi:MAG: NAD(P)H-hydrate dehydratase [Ignavibacteriales bacterium]|nr:NAD(P)H-hydrate dehydratase [Ignavibacteriales bacterium]